MAVGNLSRNKGGRLRWSRSHRTGRDVDLAFYVRKLGVPVMSPGFVRFPNGSYTSPTGQYTFHIARNWTLIEVLLSQKKAPVQWIFIARHLKKALLEHARKQRVSGWLLSRARQVLRQPTNGGPHDDHFHVRIYCSPQDILEACKNVPPYWDGKQPYEAALEARLLKLREGLGDPNVRLRVAVLRFFKRLDSRRMAPFVAQKGLQDPSPKVRHAVIDTLIHWRSDHPTVLRSLVDLIVRDGAGFVVRDAALNKSLLLRSLAPTPRLDAKRYGLVPHPLRDTVRTPHQIRRAYVALEKISSKSLVPFLTKMLRSRRVVKQSRRYKTHLPEVVLAAWASRNLMDTRLVSPLINVLEHPRKDARSAAAMALRRIAIHNFRQRWPTPMSRYKRQLAANRWRRWWDKNQKFPRHTRLVKLLKIVRPALKKYPQLTLPMALRNIIAVTKRHNYLGYNAHRLLIHLTRARVRGYDWNPEKRHSYWRKWWRSNFPSHAKFLKAP